MSHVRKQVGLGFRWLRCGVRLFRRNPWELGAMGFLVAALVAMLAAIPLFGALLAGFLFPTFLAALYLALDRTVQLPRPLARTAALKSAPRALVGLLGDEGRLVQLVVLSLGTMTLVLLAAMVAWQLAGSAWWVSTEPDLLMYARAAAALLFALAAGSVVAAGLVYALPLAFLRRQALLDAVGASFRATLRHLWALAVLEGLALLPLVLGASLHPLSPALGYVGAIASGTFVLPLAAAALYCSYRTLFPVPAARPAPVPARAVVRVARRA